MIIDQLNRTPIDVGPINQMKKESRERMGIVAHEDRRPLNVTHLEGTFREGDDIYSERIWDLGEGDLVAMTVFLRDVGQSLRQRDKEKGPQNL